MRTKTNNHTRKDLSSWIRSEDDHLDERLPPYLDLLLDLVCAQKGILRHDYIAGVVARAIQQESINDYIASLLTEQQQHAGLISGSQEQP
jgi:hypothetical protein